MVKVSHVVNAKLYQRTGKYYYCHKVKTIIDDKNDMYYVNSNTLQTKQDIQEFINTSNTNINYNYKKNHKFENIFSDIYDVNIIKVPIIQC